MNKSKRTCYFDLLNVFSCFSVVALHCNMYYHTYARDAAWFQSLVVQVLFYSAVPCFFMLSGATLFNYKTRYTTKEFYIKRIKKTVVPFLFFSIFFLCLAYLNAFIHRRVYNQSIEQVIKMYSLKQIVEMIFTGNVWCTYYWFFIHLFAFYIFVPFFEKIVNNSTEKELRFLIFLIFIFQSILPPLFEFLKLNVYVPQVISGYVFYAILGFYLDKSYLEKKGGFLVVLGIITLFCFVFRYVGILKLNDGSNLVNTYFGFFAVPPVMFIFLMCKRIGAKIKNKYVINVWGGVARTSFGIYLIHGFFLFLLPWDAASILRRTVGVLLVYFTSFMVVWVVQKIKFLRWMFP